MRFLWQMEFRNAGCPRKVFASAFRTQAALRAIRSPQILRFQEVMPCYHGEMADPIQHTLRLLFRPQTIHYLPQQPVGPGEFKDGATGWYGAQEIGHGIQGGAGKGWCGSIAER
jgi:hypothetical protein